MTAFDYVASLPTMANPAPYKFSNQDSNLLKEMGYTVVGLGGKTIAGFMQQYFPGFDLMGWLKAIETLVVPIAGKIAVRRIIIKGEQLRVRLENEYSGEKDALIVDRKFFSEKKVLTVSHEYLILPEKVRDNGIGRKILKMSLPYYLAMKAHRIKLFAGLSRGAYVWARHGFNAVRRADMDRILKKAKSKLESEQYAAVKAIYDHYYASSPEGKEFPIRHWAALPFMKDLLMDPTCTWEGILDLTNKEQLRKFNEYVSR